MTEQTDKLKKCPFCMGDASVMSTIKNVIDMTKKKAIEYVSSYWVKCNTCQVSQWMYNTEDEAIEHWNNRYVIDPLKFSEKENE